MTVGIVTGAGRGMGAACADRVKDMVDVLVLVDRDEAGLAAAAQRLSSMAGRATVETIAVDVKDRDGLARLAARSGELGPLRAVAHAAGVSPTMAEWREVLTVDLVGTAMLVDALRPLATEGTAIVCFASISAPLAIPDVDQPADGALDDPLHPDFLERLRESVGSSLEDPGMAYTWAKRGVQRFVRREAGPFGRVGARICSVTPGIIDTPMGRQEADTHDVMAMLVKSSAFGREGRPEEVASAVTFLLSDEARYVTGVDLTVDGGVIAAIRTGALSL
ncbi:MAG TPA: SDR family oxidoreductase [Acidimicrobiales bacterium]|jgi:NAD(P)-dependent dehydrogenase (short-subunit alcohol dehydrogenase family)|nr:SDR family oxidoreductase [Acidimicrobiales bacterium]